MKTVAIITSRWNSKRLPGKALVDICDKPMLRHIVDSARQAKFVDGVVVATTKNSQPIIDYCQENSIPYCAGEEDDILDRLHETAKLFNADIIVRVWGDCPLVSPEIIDIVFNGARLHLLDYCFIEGVPQGQVVAVMPLTTLERAHGELKDTHYREQFHLYFMDNPDGYNVGILELKPSRAHLNYSVDTQEDLERVRGIVSRKNKREDLW